MNPMIPLITIARKEFDRILRIWAQTLVPPIITMSLYFIIFGTFVGSQIADINGYTYIQFIVPGLIMMSVITNSYMNVASSFFGNKFQRCIEELLVSPTPNWAIVLGYSLGGVFRGIVIGFLVTLVSLFFTKLHIHSLGIIIAFVLLTSLLFSLAGMLNGIFARKFDDVSIVPTFVLTPLTYLSGIFYSISLLPPVWQTISKFNPILYMVNGFRYGFLGISDINVGVALGMLVIFTVVLFIINLILVKRGVGLRS